MDREANLPVPSALATKVSRPTNAESTTSSSSSFSSSSPPDFLRHVQAAFKRHRPLGVTQSNSIRPRRLLVPQREVSRNPRSQSGVEENVKEHENVVKDLIEQTKSTMTIIGETQDESITPPSISGLMTKSFDGSFPPDAHRDEPVRGAGCQSRKASSTLNTGSQHVDGQKMVRFSITSNKISQGAHDLMASGLENLSSHMGSLALTEMDWITSNQGDASSVINHDESKHQSFPITESDVNMKNNGGISMLAQRTPAMEDQLKRFGDFLAQPVSQPSFGPSCATTTSVHSSSVPMLNSTTYCSHLLQESGGNVATEPLSDFNANIQHEAKRSMMLTSGSSLKDISGEVKNVKWDPICAPSLTADTEKVIRQYDISKEQRGKLARESDFPKHALQHNGKSNEGKGLMGDATDKKLEAQVPKKPVSDVNLDPSGSEKPEKVASGKSASSIRKRNYDPDLFFKVNGKLYQRLGKIGSGGSSEVHKVISSDCTIYALKKIKLKGRDYATAYGFCQEIVYLNKLKGKNNIIQLVDYEVTDRTLLQEVLNGSMNNKDVRVKDDGYIYMVLEYGEIDLAHMLSQKWKEIDGSDQTIDENWLRFYWQQILQAVNTIHEERIVHSDLKPANFLLVKGSLKLIDFGIAKAIMSDTTNIQRDSQVGTLSYMSPEAFMCNEKDANGNTIKCGRPSDIWSLGCILYQMVYGRTPFSEYKTFWAKFKVITDPNHEIKYEPVGNHWLLDLMKKCLAWERNERWRIPQLLQHPFLVPPVSPHLSLSQDQSSKLLQLIAETCENDQEASYLCSQLQQLLINSEQPMTSLLITSKDNQSELFSQTSKNYFLLHKNLATHKDERSKS
ncbi:serine/threonine-protein kinase MPS1 isoform X2 [Momordica charantia]|uniref:Serine/threonine-protein kinase MPS1 isoform X2 n=1 Tax=Momordica charantia TaxID=3673 RepID=A0A6J1CKT1_MOMCH|nr:serine/threonine-protein kinase MPS1 isoform X2 [Momordica charantia]